MGATRQNIKIFTEDEIERITSNYSTPIGKGGFGEVYRGILDGDYDLVAVKRYICQDLREEFMKEVCIHSQMSHKNVVKLIGYCIGKSNLMLVTEYISKGNLDDILHCSDISIPLDVRLGIAIGCAEALSYMHSMHLSSGNLIYHGDIKPANILLDDNLTTKVSDFGLSRLLFGGNTQFTMNLKGSIGYMDPIYFHEGCLTPRSDVYSFGIVLLELIIRKRVKEGDINLIRTLSKACTSGQGLRELFDAGIADENNMKILKEVRKLAAECSTLNIHKRPQMSDVAKRLRKLKKDLKLRKLKKDLKGSPQSILATHSAWQKNYNQGTSTPIFKTTLSFFKGNASHSKILSELDNVRIFTMEEINEVTQNYSYLLGGGMSAEVYKGTLEDNTVVVVNKFLHEGSKEAFINGAMILSQIAHKNIIKLLGCCLEAKTLVFIYEYVANKGSLFDILGSQEDFPIDLRMRIAIKTAEALEYLHSSATGIIGHGGLSPSTILLDDNFVPKLTDFSRACKLIKKTETTAGDSVINSRLLEKVLYNDPSCYGSVLINLENDVYKFGCVLMALITREKNINHNDLVVKFTKAYDTDKTVKAMSDKDITAAEDITLLEEIGRLALKCTILNVDEMIKKQYCFLRRQNAFCPSVFCLAIQRFRFRRQPPHPHGPPAPSSSASLLRPGLRGVGDAREFNTDARALDLERELWPRVSEGAKSLVCQMLAQQVLASMDPDARVLGVGGSRAPVTAEHAEGAEHFRLMSMATGTWTMASSWRSPSTCSSSPMKIFVEVDNVPYVMDNGAGVFSKSPKETTNLVSRWFGPSSEESKRMLENALKLAQPEAVFDIVRDIHELPQEQGVISQVSGSLTSSSFVPSPKTTPLQLMGNF